MHNSIWIDTNLRKETGETSSRKINQESMGLTIFSISIIIITVITSTVNRWIVTSSIRAGGWFTISTLRRITTRRGYRWTSLRWIRCWQSLERDDFSSIKTIIKPIVPVRCFVLIFEYVDLRDHHLPIVEDDPFLAVVEHFVHLRDVDRY